MSVLMENDEIIYVELRCERAFSVSYMAVSLVDVTTLGFMSRWNFKDRFMLFQTEWKIVKNS